MSEYLKVFVKKQDLLKILSNKYLLDDYFLLLLIENIPADKFEEWLLDNETEVYIGVDKGLRSKDLLRDFALTPITVKTVCDVIDYYTFVRLLYDYDFIIGTSDTKVPKNYVPIDKVDDLITTWVVSYDWEEEFKEY